MIKLNPLPRLAWPRSSLHRLLLLAAVVLLLLGASVASPLLLGSHDRTHVQAGGQPVMRLDSSSTPTRSAPDRNRPSSSHAARATLSKSSSARLGPVPSVTSAAAAPPPTAPGHPIPVSAWPSMASPIHRVRLSVTTASSRPRPAPTSHTPPPAPHLLGDGGLVGSVNAFRAGNDASSLTYSSGLTGDAEQCALQMARNSSVAHCGGNQVVAGAWSSGGCMSLFESEPTHRDVLLSPAFSTAGSGVAVDAAGAYYCAINFE